MQPEQPTTTQPVAPQAPAAPQMVVTDNTTALPEAQPIQWQAPEYVQERRSPWWFIGFWVVTLVLMLVAVLVIRSWSFAILVPAMAAALMIYSHRPPRMLNYVLSAKGLYINEKLHPLGEFRSFGILKEESIPSLMLIPVKRFRPALTVHFPLETGEAIVDLLGSRIPMQELRLDVFDKVIRKLHI
jgi:hypothetical protein